MAVTEPNELDALVASIWGPDALAEAPELDPELRELQNEALSVAIRMYLQSYMDDMRRPS